MCLLCTVPAGSVSPLGQAVLPVQPARFLLPGGIRLEKTFKVVNRVDGMKESFVLMLHASDQRAQLRGSECDAPPRRSGDEVN